MAQYQHLLDASASYAKDQVTSTDAQAALSCDHLAVSIGKEILQVIPGRISTEVDARLSFDTAATIEKAKQLISLYEAQGVTRDRVLIKIASTWEGIKAAEILESQGINCNLTLLFSFAQAVAAAEAGAYLISPFVGRILDWYKASTGKASYPADEDPGVVSVTKIYDYYKSHGYQTIVMGASFRNLDEIEQLAGCDRLTISPDLLAKLDNDPGELKRVLAPSRLGAEQPTPLTESSFRWQHNDDAMATEKLAEGIRKFAEDQVKLEGLMRERLS